MAIIFGFGIFGLVISIFFLMKLDKYEFENRTSGGAVEFESYGQSAGHGFAKGLLNIIVGICTIAVIISGFFLFGTGSFR